MKTHVVRSVCLLLACMCLVPMLQASKIVVSNDEWMFTDSQIGTNNDIQFAKNLSNFVTGGSGSILILSGNFGLTGSTLNSVLTGQGYAVSYSTSQPGSLSSYNAVFLGGPVGNDATLDANLTSYVNGGGNVFVEGGTGCCGGAPGEAAYWNPFLNNFGLNFGNVYNGVCCNINVAAFQSQGPYGPVLFNGINSIYMNNGNNVGISGAGPGVQIFSDGSQNGLFGVVDTQVPEPSSLLLLASGLTGVVGLMRRRR